MLLDFIFSAEGFDFLNRFKNDFDCSFRIDEPSGSMVILETADSSYLIPDDENLEDFKLAVTKSVETGKNVLAERYKNSPVTYDDEAIY